MDPDATRRAHAIFTRALELPEAARDGLVTSECAGDPDLETQVRQLLDAVGRSSAFLESPALASLAATTDRVPDAVGTYVVVGVLGQGGMATVYEAIQERPNRRVALKVMHDRMGHPEALVRFRLETEALARLRHPGIAQIYEAGTAALGRPAPSPFFAMELVPDALPITAFAERRGLSLAERLAMFLEVCDAVEHGHQNGIIHRDLKPGNILVGPDAAAKVIDFGIARTLNPAGPRATQTADTNRLMGTLNFMSPEQCEAPADVDVRTDVYSLGVVLFELVTGRPPHDLSGCSLPQAVRLITEREPPRARSVRQEVDRDLDAVIAMAMSKDRDARYPGVGALAADLRRLLRGEPVEARHAGPLRRAWKFARRHRPLSITAAAAVLTLVAGIAVSSRMAYVATVARRAVEQRETELERVTAFQESLLAGIDLATMGDRMRVAVAEAIEHAKPRPTPARPPATPDSPLSGVNFSSVAARVLDESVLRRYSAEIDRQFADQPRLQARLLQQLADSMRSIGLHAQAEPLLRRALTLRRDTLGPNHPDTLQTVHALGALLSVLGPLGESQRLLVEACEGRARVLGPDDQLTLRARTSLGGVYRRLGDHPTAERIWADTLARQRRTLGDDNPDTLRTLNNLGVALAAQGKLNQAETCWRELVDRRKRLHGEDHPEYLSSLGNLGSLLYDQGKFAEARPMLEASLASDRRRLGDAHANTLVSMAQLGELLREVGDLPEAERIQRECYEGRRASLGPDHPDTLRVMSQLAHTLDLRGNHDDAERLLREALAAQREMIGDTDADTILCMGTLGDMLARRGQTDDALQHTAQAVRLGRLALADDPIGLGKVIAQHGLALAAARRPDEAIPSLEEAYHLMERSGVTGHPDALRVAARLAELYDARNVASPTTQNAEAARSWRAKAEPRAPN